jgi:hypothetical protein
MTPPSESLSAVKISCTPPAIYYAENGSESIPVCRYHTPHLPYQIARKPGVIENE